MFWVFLNVRWLTVKVNLVLALKAVKKIPRLRNQSSLNLKELRKEILRISFWYLWIKHKSEKYTVGQKVRVSNYRSLNIEKRFIFLSCTIIREKSVFKESFQAAGKILFSKWNYFLVKIIQDDKQRKDLKVVEQWKIENKSLKLSPM